MNLLTRPAGERLVPPHGLTSRERSLFPWQFSWANRRLEGRCFEHLVYKDPTFPGDVLTKGKARCGTLVWIGPRPIMT